MMSAVGKHNRIQPQMGLLQRINVLLKKKVEQVD